MSQPTESEILSKYRQSLGEARDACHWLHKNADPDWLAPRGGQYSKLRTAIRELEGCCRQMSMYRDDARWTKLGFVYARALRTALKLFKHQNWLGFGEFTKLFENGLRAMQDLALAKTGTLGPILPKNPSAWIIMPDQQNPGQWVPPRGAMN